ncbi:hypothetical protein LOTGIDRAFT_159707 [Lottia gigantea]|uniref:MATH domain-containing protein n=1 Tax=Lottia gigantea TaxID=225164 RepID=V4C5S0_LOTGI|nr:hypothetical protein LOTGIDRAFT_159707 [Lottia gigantea]ESO96954.1 hypothetical protein LOTGIDRAFT_159707 [Lottia gigantea]
MLCGSRFVCEFNIHELQTGQLVCSRDYQVIKGISWYLCVRKSVNKNNTGALEDVIRNNDELLGLPLTKPRKESPVEPPRKVSRIRSKRRVHFVDESTDSDNQNHHSRNPERTNPRNDYHFNSRSNTTRDENPNSSSESADNSRDDRDSISDFENQYPTNVDRRNMQLKYVESQTSSDSQQDSEISPHSLRGSRLRTEDRQNGRESSSETESDDPRYRPRNLQSSRGGISKGRSRSSRNRRRIARGNNSTDEKKQTCLDFYLKMEENRNGRLKHCTANFTLDIVNKNRGMRKVRKYKYQTFFPDDVSGWAKVITWNDLTNRDNCFVDKNGYFQIQAAVIVMNTKLLIENIKPEKLETIV